MKKSTATIDKLQFENALWKEGFAKVMGLDEVGRGCLAGPVVAAGVIFEPGMCIEGIGDSKTISKKNREKLAVLIREKAKFWTIKECSVSEIDTHNILKASLLAMQKCVDEAGENVDFLLVDGNRFLPSLLPFNCIVKGDARSMSIGAASILAKVYRDELMEKLHEDFPWYSWNENVGYPTKKHYQGLQDKGISIHHRKSFSLKTDKVLPGLPKSKY